MEDYLKHKLKAGLEIHQQLDTAKLFCSCPSLLRKDDPKFTVKRKLNPVVGETGIIDAAAKYEKIKNKVFVYEVYDTNCLVELDEEPPHKINQEAVEIALQIAFLLNCKVHPVTQIMRKTVIDGSNTSGFQRTALIAYDGFVETSEGKVRIESVALEEDAARKSDSSKREVKFRLDRLGIPLVEITTKPDLKSPEQIKEAALKIGEILRACNVKRGIGTIRQDLNISIEKGDRIEIKGFQDPKIMIQTVKNEIQRQVSILGIQDKLRKTKISNLNDLTSIFSNTKCKFISRAIKKKESVFAFNLKDMDGLIGLELQKNKRLGTDFSEQIKPLGLGGLIHSDEDMDKYDFSEQEITSVKNTLGTDKGDAFIILVASQNKAEKAYERIKQRIKILSERVPKEVRKVSPDATTVFLRPMPGAARMYPETDHPLVKFSRDSINKIKNNLPKLASENKKYLQEFGLNDELIKLLLKQRKVEDFKSLLHSIDNPSLVAKTLTLFIDDIVKKEDLEKKETERILNHDVLDEILKNVGKKISESDVQMVMEKILQGKNVEDAMKKESINLEKEIKILINEKPNLSINAYMGLIMAKHKGKVNGKEVMQELKKFMN